MLKDTPSKTMTEAEFQAVIRQYRLEALELIAPSLKILERCKAARREGRGQTTASRKRRRNAKHG